MADKDDYVFMAKMAEQAERYDEMVEYMKKRANVDNQLGNDERNLLSVAYKNAIGSRRASWRIVRTLESKEGEKDPNSEKLEVIRDIRRTTETEMKGICNDILQLLDESLLKETSKSDQEKENESQVFYKKMKGDYKRYMAEFSVGDERKYFAEESLVAYKDATELAIETLKPTNPIRLGLALNFSVFHFEILNSQERACKLAKDAFDEAISELDTLGEESYKDSTLIMQLLRDNLTLWTSDMQQGDDSGNDKGDTVVQDVEDENVED